VQGVFFRATAKRVADAHMLVGHAKNLPDGRVEILAEGDEAGLRALLDWCYRGSLLANVDGLSFEWQKSKDIPTRSRDGQVFRKFDISRDGNNLIVDQVHALTNLGRRVLATVDKKVEEKILNVPKHIVIIPDGNRHWARERGVPFWKGYEEGKKRTVELIKTSQEAGVPHMTFWGFSTENWSRPTEEVSWLMDTFVKTLKELGKELSKNKISFRHLGRKDRINSKLLKGIEDLEMSTAEFRGKTFSLALDYGGRDEILRAAKKASENGGMNDKNLTAALDTSGLPDPDFIIRTSGEQRLSGIMPWQSAYAELYFTPLYFPDFTPTQFNLALADYANRQRRFGQ